MKNSYNSKTKQNIIIWLKNEQKSLAHGKCSIIVGNHDRYTNSTCDSLTVVRKCWGYPALFWVMFFSLSTRPPVPCCRLHRDTDPPCPDFAHFHASPLVLAAWFLSELLQLVPIAQPTSTLEVPCTSPPPKSIAYLVTRRSFWIRPSLLCSWPFNGGIITLRMKSKLLYITYNILYHLVLPNSLASSGAILLFCRSVLALVIPLCPVKCFSSWDPALTASSENSHCIPPHNSS